MAPTNSIPKFLLAGVLLTSTLVLAQGTKITPPKNKFPLEHDVQVGRDAAAQVRQTLPLLPENGDIDAYVKRVGQALASAIAPEYVHPEFHFEFRVVNASDINAFALPGGPMFVNRGMIESAHDEGEMAGVMAHEMSHVVLRHGTAQETKSQSTGVRLGEILGIGAGAVLGGNAGKAVAQATQSGLGAFLLKYSRQDESDADVLGSQIMARAGYDPQDLANMFKTIEKQAGSGGPQFLSDHPNPGNRYERISQEAKKLTISSNPRDGQDREFTLAQAALKAMAPARTTAELEAAAANKTTQGAGRGNAPSSPVSSKVEPPSDQVIGFVWTGVFGMSVPRNWMQFRDSSSVTFAPEGAYGTQQGQSVFTHGAIAGTGMAQSTNLMTASDRYISGILQGNAYLTAERTYYRVQVGDLQGLRRRLAGTSPVTHQREIADVYTAFLRNGQLFYIVQIVPESEFDQYRDAFDVMVRSAHFDQ